MSLGSRDAMDAEKLALLSKSYSVPVVAAFLDLAAGVVPSKVFEDLLETGQQMVVNDPQAFGLVGGRA